MIGPWATRILSARRELLPPYGASRYSAVRKEEAEGGCGVVGFACTEKVEGRYLYRALHQMRNRGNGKGGGIAAAGLSPEALGVERGLLERDYILQVSYLREELRGEVEQFIGARYAVDHAEQVKEARAHSELGLEVRPPRVYRYYVRPLSGALEAFVKGAGLEDLEEDYVSDEFVYRASVELNRRFYYDLPPDRKAAFVLSTGKNFLVFKLVGYGHQVIQYYGLERFPAHVWIGHHRYPTKGRIWHPGGAHPFVGVHDALVHNGDFANYHAITEYLRQRGYAPLFHTDTEVAMLLFDLWSRVYRLPLEYVLEAMAPTSERDFLLLPPEKQRIYRLIQASTIHGSPDGPWFFIIARSLPGEGKAQLLGITDTSMLRPQVFALLRDGVDIGLIASEKQAIDATLSSLHEDGIVRSAAADKYWFARGGSHTDGGAFVFEVDFRQGPARLSCFNKFGRAVEV
jgi:glutamate synthase domain-containing protein 1